MRLRLALALLLATAAAHAQTLTRPPALLQFVEAEAPKPGNATVILTLDIDAEGRVTAAAVATSGGAAFDAAALDAARRFVFRPAEIDGVPAPVRIQYRYVFTARVVEPPPPTTIELRGRVVDEAGRGLAGATVTAGATRVTTDAVGAFRMPALAPGVYLVDVRADGRIAIRAQEDGRTPGAILTARYVLLPRAEDVDEELVIRAPRQIRARTRVAIRADEARTVAGTQGDTLKVVQSMPGVARAAAGSAALVVWGAAPEDTRVLVDGVEIPALYHLGGVRSTVNSAMVDGIELVPGAFGPAYGRGLGGIVKVRTRRLPPDAVTGYVAADPYDTSGHVAAPLGQGRRVGLSARYGYLDRVFAGVAEDPTVFPIPRYFDAQLQFEQDLRADEWIGLTVLGSSDQLDRQVDALQDRRTVDSLVLMAPYRRILADGASFELTPHVVFSRRGVTESFGSVPARQTVETRRAGLRGDYRAAVEPDLTVAIGLDGLAEWGSVERFGSLNRPAREGDATVFGQPPGEDVAADRVETLIADVAVHGRAEWAVGPLTVVPGLRLDVFALQSDRLLPPVGETPKVGSFRLEPVLAPRLSLRWSPVDALTLHAATGRYHQAPRAEELSAVFGNAALGIASATHLVTGAQWQPAEGLDVEVTAFLERFVDLVARAPEATPPLGAALTNGGTGESRGVQVLVRRSTGDLTGWLSYTLSRSERVDAPGQGARLFDFDQTHVLSLVLAHRWDRLVLSGRARYSTGFPRTPVVGAYYDARSDRFQPRLGPRNSTRLPAFAQLDLRAAYRAPIAHGALTISLDVINATDQANVEERAFRFDYAQERAVPGLPLLALLGARWDF